MAIAGRTPVTNNDVGAKVAPTLWADGHFPGDKEYESHGIFESVTVPRIEAAIEGDTPTGDPIAGEYISGRPFAEGFQENAVFLRLDYLDRDEIELGRAQGDLEPLLWLVAGAHGSPPEKLDEEQPFVVVEGRAYAVLFDVLALPELNAALADKPSVEHVFLLTDDNDAFAEMTTALGPARDTHMLPRDYLKRFRINALRGR